MKYIHTYTRDSLSLQIKDEQDYEGAANNQNQEPFQKLGNHPRFLR